MNELENWLAKPPKYQWYTTTETHETLIILRTVEQRLDLIEEMRANNIIEIDDVPEDEYLPEFAETQLKKVRNVLKEAGFVNEGEPLGFEIYRRAIT